jgi:uncharacterized protein (TIGR00266 family)
MDVEILEQRENAIARVILQEDEAIMAQTGTLLAMRGQFQLNTSLRRSSGGSHQKQKGGIMGESLFMTEFRAIRPDSEVWLTASTIGHIIVHKMTNHKLITLASSYLGCSASLRLFVGLSDLNIPTKGQSFLALSLTGTGQVLLSGLGGIYDIDVAGEYWVKVPHLVAFENSLKYEIVKFYPKNFKFGLGKKDVFLKLKGEGKLYCQTHQAQSWGQLISSEYQSQVKHKYG